MLEVVVETGAACVHAVVETLWPACYVDMAGSCITNTMNVGIVFMVRNLVVLTITM